MLNTTYRPLNLPSKSVANQIKERAYWNSFRPVDKADFYTMGYSGRKIADFIYILESFGVCSIVDIRFSPVSMYKPDFSKNNLQTMLSHYGISYFHFPNLGIPRDIRSLAIEEKNKNTLWEWYDCYILGEYINGNLDTFFNSAIHPIAFLCTEISPIECHRHRLALALEKKGLRSHDL